MDRLRPRRAPPVGAHRNDAPRRLRTAGRPAAGYRQGDRRTQMRAGGAAHHQCARRILVKDDRHGHPTQGRTCVDGHTERPHTSRIPYPLARHHRPAQQRADRIGRRSHHGSPFPRIPAMEGRHRAPHQRIAHSHGSRNSLCLRHRQAAGPRPLLHIPAG